VVEHGPLAVLHEHYVRPELPRIRMHLYDVDGGSDRCGRIFRRRMGDVAKPFQGGFAVVSESAVFKASSEMEPLRGVY
jgi:hypothetical protein